MEWLVLWIILINLVACLLTVVDKSRARRGGWRIPEATLFAVAALGGTPLMLFTMHRIRHKTRHRRFMWGLPLMLLAQLLLAGYILYRTFN